MLHITLHECYQEVPRNVTNILRRLLLSIQQFLDQYDLRKEVALAGVMVAGVFICSIPANSGIPVFDAANLVQNLQTAANMVTQVQQGLQQIRQLQNQLQQMQREFEAITGSRGLGQIARGGIENELKEWMPSGVNTLLTQYQSGNAINSVLGSKLQRIRDQFKSLETTDFLVSGDRGQEISAYQQSVGITQVNQASAEKMLEDLNEAITRTQTLGEQIDSTDDIKASLDLQNRFLLELTILHLYSLRLQALDLSQKSSHDQEYLSRVAQIQLEVKRAQPDSGNSYQSGLY